MTAIVTLTRLLQTGSDDYVLSTAETDNEKIKECMDYKKYMFGLFHEKLPNVKFIVMSGLILPGRSEYTESHSDDTLKVAFEYRKLGVNATCYEPKKFDN